MILMWKRHKNCKEWKKVWGTEKGADCSTNSTFRDTDKQKSFCSLGLTKKPTMLFVIRWYTKVDSNARLLKISFIKCLWSPSWKNSYCPSTKTLWEWIGQSVWSQSQQEFAGKHSCSLEEPPEKALTGDCGALIGEWADLQKRWTVALLHYSCLFQVRNNEKNDYF